MKSECIATIMLMIMLLWEFEYGKRETFTLKANYDGLISEWLKSDLKSNVKLMIKGIDSIWMPMYDFDSFRFVFHIYVYSWKTLSTDYFV